MNNEQSLDYWKQRAQAAEVKLAVYGEIVSQLVHGNDAQAYCVTSRAHPYREALSLLSVLVQARYELPNGSTYIEEYYMAGERQQVTPSPNGNIRVAVTIR